MSALCQKRLRPQAYSGDAGSVCGRPATHLCHLPATVTRYGRVPEQDEYRCPLHVEGVAVEVRGNASPR